MTHICVGKLIIIGSDNGLSPDRRQAIVWTNARLLSIGSVRTYFNENLIKIQQFSFKKMHVKLSSAKWRPSCLGLNVLNGKDLRRKCLRIYYISGITWHSLRPLDVCIYIYWIKPSFVYELAWWLIHCNWTLRNQILWILIKTESFSSKEMSFLNVFYYVLAILFRLQ